MRVYQKEKFHQLPDAIFFDLDNTVYPYEPAHHKGMDAVRGKMIEMFSLKREDFDEVFERAKDQIKRRLKGTAASHSRLLYFQRMVELMGHESQVLTALDLEQTYWCSFLNGASPFDGLHDLLDDFRLLDIPMAIVTDLTAQIQFKKMIHLDLDRYVDCIVTSEEAGRDKPHASPFQLAREKLAPRGDIIWMIGDDPTKDMVGGRKSVGAVTLQKLHEGISLGKGDCAPDASFYAYDKLRTFVGHLAGGP